MKIVFLGTRGFPGVQGGVENHCENLSSRLAHLGYDVIVLSRRPYVSQRVSEYNGVKLISIPTLKHKTIEAFLHTFLGVLYTYKIKPDIIHIHGIGPGLFAPLAKISGAKIILTTHGSNYEHAKWNRLEKKILKLCERIAIRHSNEVIAISNHIAEQITQMYGVSATIIPNGVNVISISESDQILHELGLEKNKYILSVGRLVPEKGFDNLISAFRSLELKDWKLVIVGEADHKSKYSNTLIKNTSDTIIFPGVVTGGRLHQLFNSAGLFILPSYYEGLPISLLEALSFGITCLASDVPGNRSIELPDQNYFSPDDILELSSKIALYTQCVRPRNEQQILMIREKYSWDKVAQQTIEVYEHALGQRNISVKINETG